MNTENTGEITSPVSVNKLFKNIKPEEGENIGLPHITFKDLCKQFLQVKINNFGRKHKTFKAEFLLSHEYA